MFEEAPRDRTRTTLGVQLDTELDRRATGGAGRASTRRSSRASSAQPFPEDPQEQLWGAIGAVFGSWMNQRAEHLPPHATTSPSDWGTAVNVQAMVFGNMGDDCATGVAFTRTRRPARTRFYGEYLVNAQGEDVVAGIRTPQSLTSAAREAAGAELPSHGRGDARRLTPSSTQRARAAREALPRHAGHRVHDRSRASSGMLQTRSGKRTAQGRAARSRSTWSSEGLIDEGRGGRCASIPTALDQLLHPTLDPDGAARRARQGPARVSPGAASRQGRVQRRRGRDARRGAGEKVILVRVETSPEDIHGMNAAQRHPHRARRHDQPRRGGRARHGPALRRRRRRVCDRLHARDAAASAAASSREGDVDHHRRLDRRGHARARCRRSSPSCRGDFGTLMGWADAAPPPEGAHQRRDAARRRTARAVRRRGHRPVPHRAHVLRRRRASSPCAR